MARAFVIRPFGKKKDSAGTEFDFERIHAELIRPALIAAGLAGSTTGEIIDAGNIREDMFALIVEADLVLCDITVHNANVFYELGIRHGLRKRRAVLIRAEPVADPPPFDLLTDRYLAYEAACPAAKLQPLTDVLRATMASPRETDSPVFKMLPGLSQADPATIQVVPIDFSEEVARAKAAKSAGWLRLLASEVQGLRFQWPALRTIGDAQWRLRDWEGARATWEQVRDTNPDDVPANLALANVYERLYRDQKRPELLELSSQAITRVLRSEELAQGTRAEALALEGRNQKTLWRLEFEPRQDVATRREAATNRTLRKAYEAYRDAFLVDLNHYWSGLAALQMATIANELAREPAWEDAFDEETEAKAYAADLEAQVPRLRSGTTLAVQAALKRLRPDDADRIWVEISNADLKFLTEQRDKRIVKAYEDAVPASEYFAWDAARGQLELFAALGIRPDLVAQIIATIDAKVPKPDAPDQHVVVFAGHRVDEPTRTVPRFPANRETRARELIRDEMRTLQNGADLRVLASAAPGADILCQEVCDELKIDVTMCLPVPRDEFARLAFGTLDAWRSRYITLLEKHTPVELSNRGDLPQWLTGRDIDLWERGNRWVLESARSSGAQRVTLVALWDGQDIQDPRGGTAHFVRLARETGTIDVRIIDARQLLP